MFRLAVSVSTILVFSHTLLTVWCAPRDYTAEIAAVAAKYPSVSGVDFAENAGLNYITALPQINFENKKALQHLRQLQQQQDEQDAVEKQTLKKAEQREEENKNAAGSEQQDKVKYYIYILENKKENNQQSNENENAKQITPAKVNDSKELQEWLNYFNSLPYLGQPETKQPLQQKEEVEKEKQQKPQQHQQEQQQEAEIIVPEVKENDKKEQKKEQVKEEEQNLNNKQIDYYKYLQQLALYQASTGEIVYNKKSPKPATAHKVADNNQHRYQKIAVQQNKQDLNQNQHNTKKVEAKKEAVLVNANDIYSLYNQQLKSVLSDSKLQNQDEQYYIVGGYDQQKQIAPYLNLLTVDPQSGANKYNVESRDGSSNLKDQIVLLRPNNVGPTMVILHDGKLNNADALALKH